MDKEEHYVPVGETDSKILERNNGFNPFMTLKNRYYGYTPPKRKIIETEKKEE